MWKTSKALIIDLKVLKNMLYYIGFYLFGVLGIVIIAAAIKQELEKGNQNTPPRKPKPSPPRKSNNSTIQSVTASITSVSHSTTPTLSNSDRYKLTNVYYDSNNSLVNIVFYDKVNDCDFVAYSRPDDMSMEQLKYCAPPVSTYANEIIERVKNFPFEWKLQAKIYEFWSDANKYIDQYAAEGDVESMVILIKNIYDTRDKLEYAIDIHFLIIKAINRAYPYRDSRENCLDFVLLLCDMDIDNFHNLNIKMEGIQNISLISPQKKAIILEKKKLYEEALEFCEWCHAQGIRETRDLTFEPRINRLRKKLSSNNRR